MCDSVGLKHAHISLHCALNLASSKKFASTELQSPEQPLSAFAWLKTKGVPHIIASFLQRLLA